MSCNHSEGRMPDGRRTAGHDCDYLDRREALIPRAEALADQVAGPPPDGKVESKAHHHWSSAWNRAFHAEMSRLSADVEAKQDQLAKGAETEVTGAVRRWRRKGLTLQQAARVLRVAREAIG
jgi:hypothetical protein